MRLALTVGMSHKKMSKKLQLKRETVQTIGEGQLVQVVGGTTGSWLCVSNVRTCSNACAHSG